MGKKQTITKADVATVDATTLAGSPQRQPRRYWEVFVSKSKDGDEVREQFRCKLFECSHQKDVTDALVTEIEGIGGREAAKAAKAKWIADNRTAAS